ncbi:hypothetical protein Vretimale_6505 [Volvox reticuliferus]|nr:hypothetical protein Vretifemale_20010 [Volvox reticuliferus]GIM01700.1 hypothetical protein Vretimale_6505 [Volvox reticuliferus]
MLYKYQTGQALPCAEKGCERGARTKCELHQDSQRPCVDGGVAEAAGACMLSCRTNLYRDSDMPDPDAQLAAAMATVASSGSVANEYVFSERAEESRGECSQNGGLRRRQFEREVLGNMDEERHGGAATAGDDGEAVLSWYGFRLFRRGMSPAEWSAKAATVATDG